MITQYDGSQRSSTWNGRRLAQLAAAALFLLALTAFPPVGQAQTVTEDWTCNPPTTGSPANWYQFGYYYTATPTDTTKITPELLCPEPAAPVVWLTYDLRRQLRVVVRAKDQWGRYGPWISSANYTADLGAPGGCSLIRRVGS